MKKHFTQMAITCALITMLFGCGNSMDTLPDASTDNMQVDTVSTAPIAIEIEATEPKATIEETVVFDRDGIKITAVEMTYDSAYGTGVKILVENNTSKNIVLSGGDFIVNGITVSGSLYIEVAAEKKAYGTIYLSKYDLEYSNIDDISTFAAADADISDHDTHTVFLHTPFSLETSTHDGIVPSYDKTGDVIYEYNDQITIIGRDVIGSEHGVQVWMLIINNSDDDIYISGENISVNGFTIDAYLGGTVYAQTVRYLPMTLFYQSLEESNIDPLDITEVTWHIAGYNDYTRSQIFKTEELSLSLDTN